MLLNAVSVVTLKPVVLGIIVGGVLLGCSPVKVSEPATLIRYNPVCYQEIVSVLSDAYPKRTFKLRKTIFTKNSRLKLTRSSYVRDGFKSLKPRELIDNTSRAVLMKSSVGSCVLSVQAKSYPLNACLCR